MGTAEQRAHRQAYAQNLDRLWQAAIHGQWTTDSQLQQYLRGMGQNENGALYKQLYSKGGYATYGPSWDPTRNFDFQHNQNIPWQGPGEEWYNPSVASNWQNTDPLQAARMNGFFNWRDQNGTMIDQKYGGNALAAWLQMRAASSHPNSPDMSWFNGGNFANGQGTNSVGAGHPISTFGRSPSDQIGTSGISPPDTGGMSTSLSTFAPGTEGDPLTDVRSRLKKRYGTSLAGFGGDTYAAS